MGTTRQVALLFACLSLGALALVAPVSASAQAGVCSPQLPSGASVSNSLFSAILTNLNTNWGAAAGQSIDPFQFALDDQGIHCTSDIGLACFANTGYATCQHAWVNVHVEDIAGLGALQFANLAVTSMNQKDVALHASRGPDGGKVTDNVFAPEGADWNDTNYAILLPKVGAAYAVTIDLGSVMPICGNGFQCKSAPLFQGDKNVYQVDYSTDGVNWKSVGQVPAVSGSGLRSRTVPQGTSSNPSPNFSARYVRVYAVSGDGNYSVSELRLYDTGGNIVSAGKRASGPNPVQVTDGIYAPEGADWNDQNYAIILPKDGPAHALVVDLGKVVTVCANGWDCRSAPIVQADKNEYQVDYSVDGMNWNTAGKLPTVSSSGLRTRTLPQGTEDARAPNFKARYVRIWASSGDGNYSVSEMQLYSSGSVDISTHAATFGPEPYVSNGETAPDGGTDWNDGRYATVLPPCTTATNSQCLPGAKTAAVIVDLGANFSLTQLALQADRHAFQVDISSDASSWLPLWAVPSDNTSGLSTRKNGALTGSPTGRYLRVYGTAGDDNNYSVANLSALTADARTACAYDSAANSDEAFACSYDGQFATQIVPDSKGGIPITFAVTLVEAKASCYDPPFPGSATTTLDSNSTRQSCTATLTVTPPTTPESTVAGGFCSGVCGTSGGPSAVMSYMQISGLAFEIDDLKCSPGLDSDLTKAVLGAVTGETAGAVQGLFNKLFESPDAGTKHFIPFPAACAQATADPAELAGSLDTLFSLEVPADAWKNNGNRNAALALVDNVRRAIEGGRMQPAVQQLGNLRRRFDACGAQSDWLADCAYQARIRETIDTLLQRLGKPALAGLR